jgi:hypothetical protein
MTTIINGSSPSITFSDSTTQTTAFTTTPIINTINSASATPLTFGINGTEAARFDTSGNLLVGTTSSFALPRSNLANLYSSAGIGVGNATTGLAIEYNQLAFNTSDFYIINQNTVGVYLANGGTSWTANSDERLKTDLKPIENAAEKVATLRAVTGRFKTDEEKVSRSFLIAQDVQKVLPEAVNVQSDEQGTLGLQYTDLIPLLVAAIQELNAKVEALQKPTPTTDQIAAKASATAKLTALGLTQAEVTALIG